MINAYLCHVCIGVETLHSLKAGLHKKLGSRLPNFVTVSCRTDIA